MWPDTLQITLWFGGVPCSTTWNHCCKEILEYGWCWQSTPWVFDWLREHCQPSDKRNSIKKFSSHKKLEKYKGADNSTFICFKFWFICVAIDVLLMEICVICISACREELTDLQSFWESSSRQLFPASSCGTRPCPLFHSTHTVHEWHLSTALKTHIKAFYFALPCPHCGLFEVCWDQALHEVLRAAGWSEGAACFAEWEKGKWCLQEHPWFGWDCCPVTPLPCDFLHAATHLDFTKLPYAYSSKN